MKKKITYIFILLASFMIKTSAQEINFNDFLKDAINNSPKLQTSILDTKITKHGIKEAKAAYYPTINGFATTERYNDLTNGTAQITAVGNEILLNRNYYQDMAALGASYNIFDFGARKKQLDISRLDDKQKELILKKDTKDLKLDITDIYGEALNLYKIKKIKQEALELNNKLILINKRLQKSGHISQIEVVESEIAASETKSELDEITNNLCEKLLKISFYTKQDYDINNVFLKDFPKEILKDKTNNEIEINENGIIKLSIEETSFDFENSTEAKIYDLEIAKKQKEVQIQKKVNFPKIRFDTRYNLYGSDPDNLIKGINDISQRSFSLRLSASFTLFDGFKNINTIHKKNLEIEKLKIEKEKELKELKNKYKKIELDYKNSIIQTQNNERTLLLINKNLDMLKKLNAKGLAAQSECIKKQLELLKKKEALEEKQIKNFIALYKMQIYNENNEKL